MNKWDLEEARAAGFPVKQVLHTATIMHIGWESDNEAWLVELEDGSRVVLTTNHGMIEEMDTGYTNDKLLETLDSANSIRNLIAMWPNG